MKTETLPETTQVKIIEVHNNGLKVSILKNNAAGFIPKKEFSWDRSLFTPKPIYHSGDILDALILPKESYFYLSKLSLKQLVNPNPWRGIKSKYSEGNIVNGEVVDFVKDSVFIQLEPGVDGSIWKNELPLLDNQIPSDIFSKGDKVRVIIKKIDGDEKKIRLGLNSYLSVLNEESIKKCDSHIEIFKSNIEDSFKSNWLKNKSVDRDINLFVSPIKKLNKILIIDDSESDRKTLKTILNKDFKVSIYEANGYEEAILLFRQKISFDLLIIDVGLGDGENGIEVAEKLLKIKNISILFISSNPLMIKDVKSVFNNLFPFSIKEEEDIRSWIYKFIKGYYRESTSLYTSPSDGFIRQLGMEKIVMLPFKEKLEYFLNEINIQTNSNYAILTELHIDKKQISILASYPKIIGEILDESKIELYKSPVRNVIEENICIYGNSIDRIFDRKYKYFFARLPYSSSYGLPITIEGIPNKYALFILNSKDKLNQEAYNKVDVTGVKIQSILERNLILKYMRRFEDRYLKGQLLSSLAHEIRNRIDSSIGTKASMVLNNLNKITSFKEFKNKKEKLIKNTQRILHGIEDIAQILNAYSSLAKQSEEFIDLNEVISKVKEQLQYKANENSIEIIINESPNLPKLKGVKIHLEQVFTNIALNAIQQVYVQRERFQELPLRDEEQEPLFQKGVLTIQTRVCPNRGSCQIIFIDSGPGIPFNLKNRIFQLGVSSRKDGQGLGLFISENLVRNMGGGIYLLDSIKFIGSVFLVEFPISLNSENNA